MSELEEKLSGILNDPGMMQQIMTMAKMLSGPQPQQNQTPQPAPPSPTQELPNLDPGMLRRISAILSQGGTDSHQQSLLAALEPYLSRDRIQRLERAMHAARMAGAASALLGTQSGR